MANSFPTLIPEHRCFWFVCLLCSLLVQGCAEGEKFRATTTLEQFREMNRKQDNTVGGKSTINVMPIAIENQEDGEDYLLGPGDLLTIRVFESSDLDTEVRVSSRGKINVSLIGDIKVLNLTVAETETLLEDLYRQDYIHDPHVAVHIKEHMSKQITLVGAFENPGTYDYVASRKLLDVLAIGNGLTEESGSLAYITRKDHRSGKSVNYMVNLDDLIKNGNMAYNHVIRGGDVVFIPESGQCFIDGAVRNPGTYPISSNMTITEAIALAGGLASYADDDSIKLIRFMGQGRKRQIVNLSYNDLQSGVGDTLILKDQDIIFAESSASGKLMSGTGFTLGFMGTGITFRNPEQ